MSDDYIEVTPTSGLRFAIKLNRVCACDALCVAQAREMGVQMSTEIAHPTANGTRPFQLAAALVDGQPAAVVVLGSLVYRLRDLLPDTAVPAHLDDLFADWARWQPALTAAVTDGLAARARRLQPERWLVPVASDQARLCGGQLPRPPA